MSPPAADAPLTSGARSPAVAGVSGSVPQITRLTSPSRSEQASQLPFVIRRSYRRRERWNRGLSRGFRRLRDDSIASDDRVGIPVNRVRPYR